MAERVILMHRIGSGSRSARCSSPGRTWRARNRSKFLPPHGHDIWRDFVILRRLHPLAPKLLMIPLGCGSTSNLAKIGQTSVKTEEFATMDTAGFFTDDTPPTL